MSIKLRYYIAIPLILNTIVISGQWRDASIKDSNTPFTNDSIAPFSENNNIPFYEKERSEIFYDSLALKANRKNWSKELHRLIIRNNIHAKNDNADEQENERSLDFANYENKVIRNINYKQLDVFGPTISDTSRKPKHLLEKTGNAIHVSTNKQFIKNNLFISEGERIDPYLLADNERVIRNISNIQDARIYIIPIEGSPDSVDIEIVTKDVMAFGFSWEIFDVAYGEASIWNTNILGLGHNLKYTAFYNLNREPKYGYNIRYKINNISHTFTNLEMFHVNKNDLLSSVIKLNRDFITPAIKFGGGVEYGKVKNKFSLATIDTIIPDVISDYEYYDLWGGYSFPQKRTPSNIKLRRSYFISGRVQLFNFFERPEVEENYLYEFYSRRIYLSSIGIAWQGYHKTRLVYGFGDTEDIPFGAMIKLTGGYEENEFDKRPYYSSVVSYSTLVRKIGFITTNLEFGGFYNNKIEQGVIKLNTLHISGLFGNERHLFRNFFTINYVQGVNRFDDEFTLFETKKGIRGLNNNDLIGNKRLYINNELVYYSPHYIYGFRFIYFMFLDAGMINKNNDLLIDNPLYMSTGIGLRIRNERLVFNTVQLQFNFFPISPGISGSSNQFVDLTSYPQYRMEDFANRRPEIIPYKY